MIFYSYDFLKSKVQQINYIQLGLILFIIAVLAIALYRYFKNKQDTKFRELALIAVIGILILAGSKISDLQSSKNSENQYSRALRFVETIAADLHVNKEDIYINTEAAKDGAIVKVGDQFYRVLTGDSPEHYLLEKMELKNPKVTIKEAE